MYFEKLNYINFVISIRQRRDSIIQQVPFIIMEGQRGPILFAIVKNMFLDLTLFTVCMKFSSSTNSPHNVDVECLF